MNFDRVFAGRNKGSDQQQGFMRGPEQNWGYSNWLSENLSSVHPRRNLGSGLQTSLGSSRAAYYAATAPASLNLIAALRKHALEKWDARDAELQPIKKL
jgi:hypothetical protein